MPVKGFLSQEQRKTLQKTLKEHEHPEIRERILILLLLNDGKTQREIANFLGCSLRKVAKGVCSWRPRKSRKSQRSENVRKLS